MKKIISLVMVLAMVLLLCACGGNDQPTETQKPQNTQPQATQLTTTPTEPSTAPTEPSTAPTEPSAAPTEPQPTEPEPTAGEPVSGDGPTDLNYSSEVLDLEGVWTLSKVYIDETAYDAVANALTFKVVKELDPSELVDGPRYIHNQVYNFTGYLTFGLDDIVAELAADDVENFKGTTSWEDFPRGEVVDEGQFYKQPGPATMRFKDIDDYGLYLAQIAGIADDIDTTNKTLIIGLNKAGQLLLGFSTVHLERPGTTGVWEYCLVFDRA